MNAIRFSKQDGVSILVLGEVVGAFFFVIFRVQCAEPDFGFFVCDIPQKILVPLFFVGIPIAAFAALFIASVIAQRLPALRQISKFLAVGVANTAVDWGILNLLLAPFGLTNAAFALSKGISFGIATLHSFSWNKFWTFEKRELKGFGQEALQFYIVTAVGLAINVGAATLFKVLGPETKFWAGILAPGLATVFSAVWNFLGYKLIVFRKKEVEVPNISEH